MSILLDLFRSEVEKSKDYKMKQESEFAVGYSTGFLGFDFLNGTKVHVEGNGKNFDYYSIGIADGSIVMIIGRSGCGKTTWAMQAAANIVRPFKTSCIFHDDIEGGITNTRKEILTGFFGEELRNRYISRNAGITAENFYQRIKMISDLKLNNRADYEYDTGLYDTEGNRIFKLEPTVYILDSLALLMPEKYSEEDELSGQMSATATAKANAQIFKRIIPLIKSANIILLVINHINQKVDINPMQRTKASISYLKQGETLPGGNAPQYLSNNIIRFDDNSKLKSSETFGIDGSMVDLTLVKSRTNKAGQSATLIFNQEAGFDPELSLFIMLKEHGRINGAGIGLYLGDYKDVKFSQKNFKDKLAANPELQSRFMDEVISVLKEKMPNDNREVVSKNNYTLSNKILESMNNIVE